MKRYVLFTGDSYYPAGGWNDYSGDFDSLEEAAAAEKCAPRHDWAHVIDLETGERISLNEEEEGK